MVEVILHKKRIVWQERVKVTRSFYFGAPIGLAEKVADMSATCCHDSQMSAHFAQMPLLRRHNSDPDTFFVSGLTGINQIFL